MNGVLFCYTLYNDIFFRLQTVQRFHSTKKSKKYNFDIEQKMLKKRNSSVGKHQREMKFGWSPFETQFNGSTKIIDSIRNNSVHVEIYRLLDLANS